MAGTKRQKESRVANLNKKKKTKATSSFSNARFDMNGPAGAGPAVSVYDER